jgi:hypothetical protein
VIRFSVVSMLFIAAAHFGMAAENPAKTNLLVVVEKHFASWDADKNGELSIQEVNRLLIDPQIKGESAAAVVAIRRTMRTKTAPTEKMTKESISKIIPYNKSAKEKMPDIEGMYVTALDRIQKADRKLFVSDKPTVDSIHQGKLGNCFCLAPLGAMLDRDPESVKKMFTILPDGMIEVRFGKEVQKVAPLTDAELASLAMTENQGIWINIYEKAVGQCRRKADQGEDVSLLDVLTKGGSAGSMIEVITGNPIKRFSCSPFKSPDLTEEKKLELHETLRKMLIKARTEKKLITAGTSSGSTKVPNIDGNHAYAILDYDAVKDRILVWNPHGQSFTPKGEPGMQHGYTTKDGKFWVPLKEMVQFFGGFAFEQDPEVAPATRKK